MEKRNTAKIAALMLAVCTVFSGCENSDTTDIPPQYYTVKPTTVETTTVKPDPFSPPAGDAPSYEEAMATSETEVETEPVPEFVKVSEFDNAGDFNEGHAVVQYDGVFYVIDIEGNIISSFTKLFDNSATSMKILDGDLIWLTDETVININGDIVLDREKMDFDELIGVYQGHIIVAKKVSTLERTGYDYRILDNNGNILLDWSENKPSPHNDAPSFYGITEIGENSIVYTYTGREKEYYNFATGESHYTVTYNKQLGKNEYHIDAEASYTDYGYAYYDHYDELLKIFDLKDNLLETVEHSTGHAPCSYYNTIWINEPGSASHKIYDIDERKYITFPYDTSNINYYEIYNVNRKENSYFVSLTTKDGGKFSTVIDINGNYLVEPIPYEIKNCNEGVYSTNNGLYKLDGTIIHEGANKYGEFNEGYTHMYDDNGNAYLIDINGNFLEVEFEVTE